MAASALLNIAGSLMFLLIDDEELLNELEKELLSFCTRSEKGETLLLSSFAWYTEFAGFLLIFDIG